MRLAGLENAMVLTVRTRRKVELVDITAALNRLIAGRGLREGIGLLFVPHTTAGLTINENADPDVAHDLLAALERIAPAEAGWRHREGNAPAHVKALLTGCSQLVAIEEGRLALGTWQGVFLCEFDGPRERRVHLRLLAVEGGESPRRGR